MEEQEKKQLRRKNLFFARLVLGCVSISTLTIFSGFSTYQNKQHFDRLDAEEKFSRLPEYINELSLLKDPDKDVRFDAAAALLKLQGKKAIPQVLPLLKNTDDYGFLRSAVAKILLESQGKKAIPQVLSWLEDTDGGVRVDAARVLVKLQAKEAIPQLVPLLKDPDRNVRVSVAIALVKLQGKEAIPRVLLWLKDPAAHVRTDAAAALFELPEKEAIPHLLPLLKDSGDKARHSYISALTEIYITHHQKSDINVVSVDRYHQNLNLQLVLTAVGSVSSIVLLLLMLRSMQQLRGIAWHGHLHCYLPEEIVAELTALRERLTKEKKSTWLIRSILFYQILTLVWGIYIQVNIDNLWLPSGDRRIDK